MLDSNFTSHSLDGNGFLFYKLYKTRAQNHKVQFLVLKYFKLTFLMKQILTFLIRLRIHQTLIFLAIEIFIMVAEWL